MTDTTATTHQAHRPRMASFIRSFAPLIVLGWLAITVVLTLFVPPLEVVEATHSVSLTPTGAPSVEAAGRMGKLFKETNNSASVGVIVLEGDKPLGADAHKYYDEIIQKLKADPKHVQHIQDFWGDPLTAGAAQSQDGKAVYVQLDLVGTMGQATANQSVKTVQDLLNNTPAPPGVKAYLTGPAPIIADMSASGNRTVLLITAVSVGVIFLMLLLLYRSFITTIILLLTVGMELQVARGLVALLGLYGIVGLTTYVVNLLVTVGIAAGTDYGIFFVGRYQEARQAGEDRESAFYTSYKSVAKVVLASGLTIAGAIACLRFTRLPYFQPLGVPGAVGVLVAVAVALTLIPAAIALGSRFHWFDPRRTVTTHRWRRIGTAIVRWPVPIFVASSAIMLVGLLTLPGYRPSYNDQKFIPQNIPASKGYAAAARHFPESKLTVPDILLVESDHDMRNSADFLILNKLAKAIFAVPGIANVQSVTRPEGKAIDHTSVPYMLSWTQANQQLFMPFQKARMQDMLDQANDMATMIQLMRHMQDLMTQMVNTTHSMVGTTHELEESVGEVRDHLADFDDFFRPIRNYLYWEPHCYDIPICWSIRSIFDALDGVNLITEKMRDLVKDLDQLDIIMPQMLLQLPQMIATLESTRTMMLTMHSTMGGLVDTQMNAVTNPMAMGNAFDESKNEDSFFMAQDIIDHNAAFQQIKKIFMSPDGKAARFLITQNVDPATPTGISRVEPIQDAATEALKGTPLENATVFLAGTAAATKELVEGSKYDLLIAGVAALCLIFIIM
ncbi:MAG: RND family transporter, partial [Mycobacterium sp.]|nr:RND family transporter [Mycobacterium sp.]